MYECSFKGGDDITLKEQMFYKIIGGEFNG